MRKFASYLFQNCHFSDSCDAEFHLLMWDSCLSKWETLLTKTRNSSKRNVMRIRQEWQLFFFCCCCFWLLFCFFFGFFFFNFCFLINAEKKNNYLQYDCWHYNTILATYTTYATILYSYSTHTTFDEIHNLYTNTYITYNTMVYLKYASYITCSTFFFN